MKPSISIILDKRKKIVKGEDKGRYHVKVLLTIYLDGKRSRYYYKTNVFASPAEFKQIMLNPRDQELKDKRKILLDLEEKGTDIITKEKFLTPEIFEDRFTSAGSFRDPLGLLLSTAEELRAEGRVGNAIAFEQSWSSLNKFSGGRLSFIEITPKWLKKYEKHCLDNKLSVSTIGIYLRPLRSVFNQERGKSIPMDMYPFRENSSQKDKYVIPTSKGRKMALTEDQKNKVLSYHNPDKDIQRAVDFWIFSYFCNGMNFADIARLKVKEVANDVILLDRAKTSRSVRVKDDIVIPIRDEVRKIMIRWGNNNLNPDSYVFPVLSPGLTESQVKDRIRDFISDTNDQLKKACNDMKIPVMTTYWARHTFATISLRKGATIEMIQEALGHADPKTTKAYLDGFDLDSKKALSSKL